MGSPFPYPTKTIPDLPPAPPLVGSEMVWINQAGVDVGTTLDDIIALTELPPAPPPPFNGAPGMDGVAAPGTSLLYARGDHVHPTDISLVPLAGGIMGGPLYLYLGSTAPTVTPATDSSGAVASTGFVQSAIAATGSNTTPLIDAGTGAVGTDATWARGDHVHPLLRLDQVLAPTANVSMNGLNLLGLADPVNPQDAATKNYVDAAIQGMVVKPTANYATAGPLPANTYANGAAGVGATLTGNANGALVVDGAATAANQIVLVHNEVAAANNGLYVVTQAGSGTTRYVLTRHNQMNQATEMSGALVAVESGTSWANSLWLANPATPVVVGTTPIPWTQLNSATSVSAGNGIQILANTISAVPANGISVTPLGIGAVAYNGISVTASGIGAVADNGISVSPSGIAAVPANGISVTSSGIGAVGVSGQISVSASGIGIAATYAGQASITTLGTITAGVWNAGAITAPSVTGSAPGAVLDNFTIDAGTF